MCLSPFIQLLGAKDELKSMLEDSMRQIVTLQFRFEQVGVVRDNGVMKM